ncbi:MAG: hemolysin family protein [Bdellovibrionota bacterium]
MDNIYTLSVFFIVFSILLIFFTISNWTLSRTKSTKLKNLEEELKKTSSLKFTKHLIKNRDKNIYSTYIYIIIISFCLGVCLYKILNLTSQYFLKDSLNPLFLNFKLALIFPITSIIFLSVMIFIIDLLKGISSFNAEKTLTIISPVLYIFCKLLAPIPVVIININNKILQSLGKATTKRSPTSMLSQKEIEALLEESTQNGLIEDEEKELIKGVINFSDTTVREIMIPRHKIAAVEIDDEILEVSKIFSSEGFSRLVVYAKELDDVKGMVLAKDVLTYTSNENHDIEALKKPIKTLMRQAYFVRENKQIDSLLQEFRKQGIHLAVVLDEHGGVEGIITIEDLLEEIVGDIMDEHDVLEQKQSEPDVIESKEGVIIVSGALSIHDFNEHHKPTLPEGEYESIAGFMLKMFSKMPQNGENFEYNNHLFIAAKVDKYKIDKIKIVALPKLELENKEKLEDKKEQEQDKDTEKDKNKEQEQAKKEQEKEQERKEKEQEQEDKKQGK